MSSGNDKTNRYDFTPRDISRICIYLGEKRWISRFHRFFDEIYFISALVFLSSSSSSSSSDKTAKWKSLETLLFVPHRQILTMHALNASEWEEWSAYLEQKKEKRNGHCESLEQVTRYWSTCKISSELLEVSKVKGKTISNNFNELPRVRCNKTERKREEKMAKIHWRDPKSVHGRGVIFLSFFFFFRKKDRWNATGKRAASECIFIIAGPFSRSYEICLFPRDQLRDQ